MAKTLVARTLGTIAYQSGQRQTLEIDRDGVLAQINLRIQYTVTNGASAAVGPFFQALARIVRRFEILVGGRDTIIGQAGEALTARALLEFGTLPYGMGDTVVLTGSAATVYHVVIPIPLWLPRGRRPDDTALDLRDPRIRQVVLGITWAASDCTELYTTPNSAAISAVTCEVEGEYLLDVPAAQQFLVRVLDEQERELTGTNDAFDFILDRGNQLAYRSFLITSLAAKIGLDTIINTIELKAGSFVFAKRNAVAVKAEQKRDYQQEAGTAGLYFLTPLKFGEVVDSINTGILTSDLRLLFNATKQSGTNIIKVHREAVRPLNLS